MNPDTFRWDPDLSVLWAGQRSYPARFRRHSMRDDIPDDSDFIAQHPSYRMETRQATVHFENRWRLSTIWGDGSYSSNSWYRAIGLNEPLPFIEEPTEVEVGVGMPDPIVIPATEHDLPSGKITLPERASHLWGDPLGYVTVPEYHRVADLVMMLPNDMDLPAGEWEDAEGFCDLLVTAGLERVL